MVVCMSCILSSHVRHEFPAAVHFFLLRLSPQIAPQAVTEWRVTLAKGTSILSSLRHEAPL